MSVVLQPWHRDLGPHVVSGSLYAVDPGERLEAARLLHEAGCRVHVDVIVGPGGHQGVTWAELYAVRALLPEARLDLHLIVLHDGPDPDAALAVRAGHDLALATLATAAPQIAAQRPALDVLRQTGVRLLEEVAPTLAGPREPLAGLDGALLMLVPPGTRQPADASLVGKVETLARTLPVAVDGGVTPELAHRCRRGGAEFVVSGRSLLSHAPSTAAPTAPPRTTGTTPDRTTPDRSTASTTERRTA